jgi:5-methylcytosine-specific restriction protein B
MGSNKDQFYSWLQTELKDKGWQIARSGAKVNDLTDKHRINTSTGFWQDPNYSGSKPPRWVVQFKVDSGNVLAMLPNDGRSGKIGQANTSQSNAVGVSVRILPVMQISDGKHEVPMGWEWNLLFLMPYPVPVGSSSESFDYRPESGELTYKGQKIDYIFAGLLSLNDANETIEVGDDKVTYGQATNALQSFLSIAPLDGTIINIPVYDLSSDDISGLSDLKADIEAAMDRAPEKLASSTADSDEDSEPLGDEPEEILPEIPEDKDLLGVDPAVYRQINAALKSGKQHIMLYGPPGTGKTTLARWVATKLAGSQWNLITGSADWSSQDIIGGYQPVGDGQVAFIPGILLKTFDQPLIIDELNRCDIDKVLGPLFTVLSGHHTTLPYRIDVADANSPAYTILPSPKGTKAEHEFAPGERWRLIATINSIDKASLYQMSYALSRRFGWIYVDAPKDKKEFLSRFLKDVIKHEYFEGEYCPLALIWDSINQVRVLGAAPFIDMAKAVLAMDEKANFFENPNSTMKSYLLDSIDMFLLPLMDGILRHDAEKLIADLTRHMNLTELELEQRIKDRLLGISI